MTEAARLLVVDDEESNRDLLSRRLERNGFQVECAENGERALACIDSGHYDLVLLDAMMPGMSGLDVLKQVRAGQSPEELPVIMVTAVTDSSRIAEALDLGANDYVTKPVDFQVALARVRSQLARKQAEAALRLNQERHELAARGADLGLWDWDLASDKVYFSPRGRTMLGLDENETIDVIDDWVKRVHEADRPDLMEAVQRHLSGATPAFSHEYRLRDHDGSSRWLLSRGMAVRNRQGEAVRFAGSFNDVTQTKTIDVLTGLPNRLLLIDRMQCALERAQSQPGGCAVLFMDVDRFKLVNDGVGHLCGDHLLVEAGRRISEVAAKFSAVAKTLTARVGGDEFAILLESEAAEQVAQQIADSLLRAFHHGIQTGEHTIFCSISIGIAVADGERSAEELLRDADTAMYAAKANGKGCWKSYDPNMRERTYARLQIESDLRKALELEQFRVYYQPRVHLTSGRICGFEALVRWVHPERGMINPVEFIPVAEETGLINELGLWVLRDACRQMRAWQQRFPLSPPLDVSVNVSPRQCLDASLPAKIRDILSQTRLPPETLQLEITESLLLIDLTDARRILNELKATGVGLKVDDFGTGYSCLRYLSSLPFDSLKIDRSFTMGLAENDSDCEELVRTIVSLAQNLKMEAIAEGVENTQQVELLKAMGCEYGQGYLYSRPVDAAATEELLLRRFPQ